MAAVSDWRAALGSQGKALAALQIVQIGSGLLGQLLLLTRWSPHAQTDLFLVVANIPWLISALVLIPGLEMAVPAAFHRVQISQGRDGVRQFMSQVTGLALLAGTLAALAGASLVVVWLHHGGLSLPRRAWMGIALGLQVLPAALAGIWRGQLVAQDRLIPARLAVLAGSLSTTAGYAFFPGPPAVMLPLVTLGAMAVVAWVSRHFSRDVSAQLPASIRALHPEILPLVRALVALSTAAGLVHLQLLVERRAVMELGTGSVAAFSVAGRGWEAFTAVIVAAAVMPVYPRWAALSAHGDRLQAGTLLRWSLLRSLALSGLLALAGGMGAYLVPLMTGSTTLTQAARFGLALLPRFVLVSGIQPLVLKHFASGTPWYPVIGSSLGIVALLIAAPICLPRWDLGGVLLMTTAAAVPGWLWLGWIEWGQP